MVLAIIIFQCIFLMLPYFDKNATCSKISKVPRQKTIGEYCVASAHWLDYIYPTGSLVWSCSPWLCIFLSSWHIIWIRHSRTRTHTHFKQTFWYTHSLQYSTLIISIVLWMFVFDFACKIFFSTIRKGTGLFGHARQ